jgi:ABC-type lipoprotein export system ATPase subunit
MKVSELYIKKYHQFEDFKLNLTYPEGHKLAGQPLNKVCFIGQSGTGKTSLLEILRFFIENNQPGKIGTANFKDLEDGSWIDFGQKIFTKESTGKGTLKPLLKIINNRLTLNFFQENNFRDVFYWRGVSIDNIVYLNHEGFWIRQDHLFTYSVDRYFSNLPLNSTLFYFPCDIQLPKRNVKNKIPSKNDLIEFSLKTKRVINFEDYNINQIWQTINEAIIEDRELEIKKSLEISKLLRDRKISKKELDKATDEFRKWREETPSPIQDLADNYLDKIIGRFNLKVKTELDFERKEDIETIKIQQKNGTEIPFEALSTGTKQVILTALPLYGLKPKDSIILFDEPERSLYPDIQTEIVDFYTSMAENSQFFFATHSPLVASSFEPWEIVELKFNEETGNVEQELYYDPAKERHVDNYTIYPQYLTYDGILKRVFDFKKEPNDLRTSELVKLATLESQLKHNNLSLEDKKEKFEEYKKLADLLNWDLK